MEQDRLKVEAVVEEWVAHLPQGRTESVSVRNVGTRFRMFAGNPATK
jgi:hypothetical protein